MRRSVVATIPAGVLVLLTGCAGQYGGGVRSEEAAVSPTQRHGLLSRPSTERTVQVWFWRHGKPRPVNRRVPGERSLGSEAVEALLAGPTESERARGYRTLIPAGTELRGEVTLMGSRAVANMSSEFSQRPVPVQRPDRSVELYKLAQVVYTLTGFSEVTSGRVVVEGRSLTSDAGSADWEQPGLTRVLLARHERQPSGGLACSPVPSAQLSGDRLELYEPRPSASFGGGVVRWSGRTRALGGDVMVQLFEGDVEVWRSPRQQSCNGRFSGSVTPPPTLAGPLTLTVSVTSPVDGRVQDMERRHIFVG
jgi:hypothetical protein